MSFLCSYALLYLSDTFSLNTKAMDIQQSGGKKKKLFWVMTGKLKLTSGVSAGQIIPHRVLWSCLGFANFPSLPIGELRRRRWDKVEAKVKRFNTYQSNIQIIKLRLYSSNLHNLWSFETCTFTISSESVLVARGRSLLVVGISKNLLWGTKLKSREALLMIKSIVIGAIHGWHWKLPSSIAGTR